LHRKKGVDVLCQAFSKVVSCHQTAHLVVIGPDEGMLATMKAILAKANCESRATFTGMVTGQDKIDLMSTASAIVVPSYSENFGNVVIEALGLGIPTIISSGIAISGQFGTAGAAVVVDPDSKQLSDAILSILRSPGDAQKMAHVGRKLVKEQFTWTAVGEKMEILYRSIRTERAKMPRGKALSR
jgi:glycosyltransferase involved in cell wall biosynthesis